MSSPDPDSDLHADVALRRGYVVDEFSTDEGTVVMVGLAPTFEVLRLSPLGVEILRLVGPGTTLARLEQDLRRLLGDPAVGELPDLVLAAVVELRHHSVIVAGQGHNGAIWAPSGADDRASPQGA